MNMCIQFICAHMHPQTESDVYGHSHIGADNWNDALQIFKDPSQAWYTQLTLGSLNPFGQYSKSY